MKGWLERFFRLEENRTTVRVEMLGGVTTFMTMSYIIFFQPAVLSAAGMDKGAVMVATPASPPPWRRFSWDCWRGIPSPWPRP
jgi:AGZA family xanthine/uracil permease-like MFS transporter